jgi:uncharacterized RmlC-like cupin family protein
MTAPIAGTSRVPRVIHQAELSDETGQTENLARFVAVDPERMAMDGPSRIFFGKASTPPHSTSGPHHHGEAETAGYVLSGSCRIYFGEDFKDFVECQEGDFMYVPPNCPHIEVNDGDVPFVGIFARSPENILFNLDE